MDAVDRLTEKYINDLEADLAAIRSRLRTPPKAGPTDRKAVVHCHSLLSHDCRGSLDEIADAAKQAGIEVVMITDHPRPDIDVITDGFKGRKRGVLFFPGAETRNLLIVLTQGRLDYSATQKEIIAQSTMMSGMAFLSHLEEQKDWDLDGLTGTEIYNAHFSFKKQGRLSEIFKPRSVAEFERLLAILVLLDSHPETGLSAICDIPDEYLSGWDRLLAGSRTTGIAANDSHANFTLQVHRNGTGALRVTDFVGRILATLPPGTDIARLLPERGAVFRPDSYEASFRHVATHLVLNRLGEDELADCLSNGRCYVGFDWLADTKGFHYWWETDRAQGLMGDCVATDERAVLLANLPVPAQLILKRDGKVVRTFTSNVVEYRARAPGSYRLEAYLRVAGEMRPWIYSNPIYVTADELRANARP